MKIFDLFKKLLKLERPKKVTRALFKKEKFVGEERLVESKT